MPADWEGLREASRGVATPKMANDEELYLDILTDVYKSGSIHREDYLFQFCDRLGRRRFPRKRVDAMVLNPCVVISSLA